MGSGSSLSKALSRALDANLRYSALATKLAASAIDTAFSAASGLAPVATTLGKAVTRTGAVVSPAPRAAAILLEGKAGDTAVGFFVVENSLAHEISTPVEVSPLIAADGRQLQSALRFQPGTISLAAGEQVVAKVSAKIGRQLVVGERYEGEISVPGVAGARIPIVLQRNSDATKGKAGRSASKVSAKVAAKKRTTPKSKPQPLSKRSTR
jgi:hypothetical protein